METKRVKKQLSAEGFPFIYVWKDEPGTIYPNHMHKDRVALYVLHGSVTFDFKGKKKIISAAQRFDVPPHTSHTALVGRHGCEYIVGEMIEGDA